MGIVESVPRLTLMAKPVSVMAFAIPALDTKLIVWRGRPIGVPLLSTIAVLPAAESVQSVSGCPGVIGT